MWRVESRYSHENPTFTLWGVPEPISEQQFRSCWKLSSTGTTTVFSLWNFGIYRVSIVWTCVPSVCCYCNFLYVHQSVSRSTRTCFTLKTHQSLVKVWHREWHGSLKLRASLTKTTRESETNLACIKYLSTLVVPSAEILFAARHNENTNTWSADRENTTRPSRRLILPVFQATAGNMQTAKQMIRASQNQNKQGSIQVKAPHSILCIHSINYRACWQNVPKANVCNLTIFQCFKNVKSANKPSSGNRMLLDLLMLLNRHKTTWK